jgi:hypothetical protein
MINILRLLFVASAAMALAGCQTAQSPTGGPGFEENPTDSGSRYSQFSLPGSRMGMQNVDLDD